MKNSFNRLLVALAIFDCVFIIFVVLDYTFIRGINDTILNADHAECIVWQWPITQDSSIYAYLLPKVIYPLNNISLCCSIFTTIVIAFERFGDFYNPGELSVYARYTAVCNPYLYKENNTAHRVTNRVLSFLVSVIIFSLLINIPRYFETVIISETVNITTADNETVQEERVSYDITPLRMDANYIRYSGHFLLGTEELGLSYIITASLVIKSNNFRQCSIKLIFIQTKLLYACMKPPFYHYLCTLVLLNLIKEYLKPRNYF